MTDVLVLMLFIIALCGSILTIRMARGRDDMTGRTIYVLSVMLAVIQVIGIAKWVLIVL